MFDLAAMAGIPVVCGLMATLWLSTRAWHPRYAQARRRYVPPRQR
jgi:hypothetical protein